MKLQDMKINFNTVCEFEKLTKKGLFEVIKSNNIALNDIRAIVSASLKTDENKAGTLIEEYAKENGFEEFTKLFSEKLQEFNESFGKK